ncbi:MAG: ADP-forming succinate--CoA ligase subunit beta [Candidatus Sumerlaeaceae bacterium]|nr:ADP-forming succinate--CoA ligase subunit beta [Candidatus Sumerlaeaceae bacterium]
MKIHEYQAKNILKKYGVRVPEGVVARTPGQAAHLASVLAQKLGFPLVAKSQVLVGGRGKAGGIKVISSADQVDPTVTQLLGMTIKGEKVKKLLIEQGLNIAQEIYLGAIVDRARKKVIMMTSAAGGVEIEQVAAETPEKILFTPVEPLFGLTPAQVREMFYFLKLGKENFQDFSAIALGLYRAFVEKDCSLAEINPLVLTHEGHVIAADAKMNFDDNSLWRHPDIARLRDPAEEPPAERKARKLKLNYVKLDGKIGCIVNGAGLAMATMDIVKHFGGEPANFLDIGGGAKSEQVTQALKLITSDRGVNTIFINIFGGIVRCDLVAEGILKALEQFPKWNIPIVVRLSGTNEERARELLKGTQLIPAATMTEGAQKAVELSKR